MTKNQKNNSATPEILPDGKVLAVDIVSEMKESYLDYSMSVIVSRALPDVRDGLKPVHRRILYSMNELGLSSGAKFRKSALVVGDVLGKYHPHGDIACYDALARMVQDFSMRYPLIIGQGNFGSIDGDSPAAMRYTEVKMAPLASEILRDIDKETVNFGSNYDSSREEPLLLPALVPNLLLNGTVGIAVGMATKIPPHNLGEVVDGLLYLIDHPEATSDDLAKIITGPDFPTGGLVFNEADIRHAYATGRGGVLTRGEAEIIDSQIIITSIPYQTNKAELIIHIADLVREKKIEGIKDLRDESTTLADTRIVIDLKNGSYPEKVLNAIYKHTELESLFHYNMLALVDGVPKLLSLPSILEEFVKHRREIITRRARHDLREAEAREHILLGLSKALDQIDAVIRVIKRSRDVALAEENLIKEFAFSSLQAKAILEMRLQKLAGLEREKIEAELKEKQALIRELKDLLAHPAKVTAVMTGELKMVRDKYADSRRTKVIKHSPGDIRTEDLIPDTEAVLVVSRGGYLKRTDPAEYRSQKRGGVGVVDLDTKEEDFVSIFITARTHDDLLFFSDRGKVYQIKMYDVPEGKRATRGKSLANFLPLADNERITSVLPLRAARETKDLAIMMITKQGVGKKVAATSLREVRRSGLIAITLEPGDELLSSFLVAAGEEVMVASALGQAIRFKALDVREMGRGAKGVRVIKLRRGDSVVGASPLNALAKNSGAYLVVTANGFGKKTLLKEYKIQRRGGSGIKTAQVTKKTGELISARVVTEADTEIITVSKNGQVIRTKLAEISTLGRQTQGVRVMKLRADDSLASLTCL